LSLIKYIALPVRYYQFHALAVMAATVGLLSTDQAAGQSSWFRVLNADRLVREPRANLAVGMTEYEKGELSAVCWFRHPIGRKPIILHGAHRSDGMFSPWVDFEVATEGTTKWRKIPASVERSGNERITVGPSNRLLKLWVDMSPFQKSIGKFRFGRIVLETGDKARLQLDDLLPTADARSSRSGFKAEVLKLDENKRSKSYPIEALNQNVELFSVTSYGSRLFGDFILEPSTGKPAHVKGWRTSDGYFWPDVVIEAMSSGQTWKVVGRSQKKGTPTTLSISSGESAIVRVALDAYQTILRHYDYGKVVFSNEQFSVFSLDLLCQKRTPNG
jgi:hypothetical protein